MGLERVGRMVSVRVPTRQVWGPAPPRDRAAVRKFGWIIEKYALEGRESARMVAAPTEAVTSAEAFRHHGHSPCQRQYHSSGPVSVVVFSTKGKVIMDVDAMLKALYQERELLSQAIVSLENLVRGKKRRGRPPRWLREGRHGASVTAQGRKSVSRES